MPAAEADLDDIAAWIARDSQGNAFRFITELRAQCIGLSENPRRFPRLSIGNARGLRKLSYQDYLVLYRVVGELVEVLRIVHGARNLSKLLG
jgi:toxin ParE1/3/4